MTIGGTKQDRFYRNSKGAYVPSGTTVLPRPFLADWASNCAVDYISGLMNKEWGTLRKGEFSTLYEREIAKARMAYERESTEAADYGTYIHTLCEYVLETGEIIESPHEMTQKFMDGFEAWIKKYKITPITMEHEVVTDTYGGRLDLVCEMDGVVTLVDFKTGKGVYYDNWKYQLAGYRQAWDKLVYYRAIRVAAGLDPMGTESFSMPFGKNEKVKHAKYRNENEVKSHGVLKFNKETMKVNYKSFNEYSATRTKQDGKFINGKLETEKYTRTYEDDKNTFNALVKLWWLQKRGIVV